MILIRSGLSSFFLSHPPASPIPRQLLPFGIPALSWSLDFWARLKCRLPIWDWDRNGGVGVEVDIEVGEVHVSE